MAVTSMRTSQIPKKKKKHKHLNLSFRGKSNSLTISKEETFSKKDLEHGDKIVKVFQW